MAICRPTGTNDFLPDQQLFWLEFQRVARQTFGLYGYQSIEVPILEQTDLFVRGIGEATDVVSKEMFTAISGANLETLLQGGHIRSKSNLSLRPEGTAGTVRAVVENNLVPQGAAPCKLMYAGPMFRAERPAAGRYRQFYQIGIECLGSHQASVDAEAIIMLMRFYQEMGIPTQETTLLLNSMGCSECRPQYRNAVADFMQQQKHNLCETCQQRMHINPLRAFDCKNEACAHIMQQAPRITDYLCDECKQHHATVKRYLQEAGIDFVEDSTLVRGLDYYTRTVFEVQANTGGSQNAIGGGGRYDKLAEEIGGNNIPGFGFAVGFERCKLTLEGLNVEMPKVQGPNLFIACVDNSARERAFALVQQCRDAGISAEQDHQMRSVKSQFKLANKLGAQYIITLGPDELKSGYATLRDMNTHNEQDICLKDVACVVKSQLLS